MCIRDRYLEDRQGLSDILRTLFWPTDGVVEIAAYNQVWADRTPQPPSDLFIFRISQEGYQRLRRYLRSTIISSDPIETVRNSRFFRAARSYHLFHQCHHYAALALQEAGLPISTFWAFNRSTLAMQLHRAKSLENEKIEAEPHEGSCQRKPNLTPPKCEAANLIPDKSMDSLQGKGCHSTTRHSSHCIILHLP